MTSPLPPDAEKYREQLEARARIYYATSDLFLRVARDENSEDADTSWLADLHRRSTPVSTSDSRELTPAPELPLGYGSSAERALEAFAEALDERERELAS